MDFIGEKQRLAVSKKQIEVFRRVAVDGRSGRFEAERQAAGAADRARDKQEYDVRVRVRRGRNKLVRREGAYLDPTCDSSSDEYCESQQVHVADKARGDYAKGRGMRAAATAAAATKCTAQMWARKERREVLKGNVRKDRKLSDGNLKMGVQLVNDQEECYGLCYTNVTDF